MFLCGRLREDCKLTPGQSPLGWLNLTEVVGGDRWGYSLTWCTWQQWASICSHSAYCTSIGHLFFTLSYYELWCNVTVSQVAVISQWLYPFSLSPDFSILYIHCFVYTVYDDFSGQQSNPGHSGQNAAHHHTNNTATETDTGGFSTHSCTQTQGNVLLN